MSEWKSPIVVQEINKNKEKFDELNLTAEFYHPNFKDNGKQVYTTKKSNDSNNERIKSKISNKQIERSDSLNSKKNYTGRSNHDPYGPRLKLRSNSNKVKYQMYNPKNMPYRKLDQNKSKSLWN